MWPRISVALKRVGFGAAVAVAAFLILMHGTNLVGQWREDFSDLEPLLEIPMAPVMNDHAFATVLGIASVIHDEISEPMRKKPCIGGAPALEFNWDCLAFLESQAAPLKTFDQWLAGPSPYKLAYPREYSSPTHSRFVFDRKPINSSPIPNFLAFEALGQLLVVRSVSRLSAGDTAGAARDIRTLFALGDFLQQAPMLIPQMVGLNMHQRAAMALALRWHAGALPDDIETALPDLRTDSRTLRMWRWALGLEALSLFNSTEQVASSETPWWYAAGGFYSSGRTKTLMFSLIRNSLRHVEEGRFGASFFPARSAVQCDSEEKLIWLARVPNFFGSVGFCGQLDMYNPGFARYTAKLGRVSDGVEATRIVLAARRFWREHKRWPAQETDLVPRYLTSWPISALDGQPIRWTEDRRGISLLDDDGVTPCKVDQIRMCVVPFEPSDPVVPGRTATKKRSTS